MSVINNILKKSNPLPGLFILEGAVNTGVLISNGRAVLFDCCDSVMPEDIFRLGVKQVDMVLCTEHRRMNIAGAYRFAERGARLVVPSGARKLFEDVGSYWKNWRNRWHIYHHRPNPEVLAESAAVSSEAADGDVIQWEGYRIRVLGTPGMTDGSISFLVSIGGTDACFCGDLICCDGKIWDIYSLQKGLDHKFLNRDYHGFMGAWETVVSSLYKLLAQKPDLLIPSHENIITGPASAVDTLKCRLKELYGNYTAVSALNYFAPEIFSAAGSGDMRLKQARTGYLPHFIRFAGVTSYIIVSATGEAFLVDCGDVSVADNLYKMYAEGSVAAVEGCWLTHYHDDHVGGLHRLESYFHCPVMADSVMAEMIEYPGRFYLPCISQEAFAPVRATADGESWRWHEYTMTAFHFPGQTLYHGGLLVEGHGKKVFFAGDSFSPSGIDDYCCGNRNFIGRDRGFRRCIEILRKCKPDYLVHQHLVKAVAYTDEQYDYLENMLTEREGLLRQVLPWEDPNFGTDEWWIRTYPYEQEAFAGSVIAVDVAFTNHGLSRKTARISPVLPDGWEWFPDRSNTEITVPAGTCGWINAAEGIPDRAARIWIGISAKAAGDLYAIPFRIVWDGRYLGQVRHAMVRVMGGGHTAKGENGGKI